MALEQDRPVSNPPHDPDWDARLRYWRVKLGRLRLGVEPIDDQLARYHRATLLLTAIPAGIGLMFVALFSAFGRPDVGLVVAAVLFLPVVALAWLDYAVLRSRASGYLRDLREHESRRGPTPTKTPGGE